jgi:UDP-glucosyl transferase 73C
MIRRMEGRLISHHVMMLPSLGHGHLIPFMQLAKKLAAKGLTVTFVVTFHHISSLQKKVNAARESGLDIRLVEMEVTRDELALGKVNSNSVQWHQLPPLLAGNERLQEPFHRFLQRYLGGEVSGSLAAPRLSCLIADMLLGWASAVAKKFDIPRVCFDTCWHVRRVRPPDRVGRSASQSAAHRFRSICCPGASQGSSSHSPSDAAGTP